MNLPVPDNEVVQILPESYKKILMSESDVEKFIEDALQNNKQPVFFLEQIGVLIVEFWTVLLNYQL